MLPLHAVEHAVVELRQAMRQLGAHRHGVRRRRSASAPAGRRHGRSGWCRSRGRPPRSADPAGRRGAHRDLLVECPQILERAAAARHDQHVRARHRSVAGSALKPDRCATRPRRTRPEPRPPTTGRGERSARRCRMSRMTAPVGEVTSPITRAGTAPAACARDRTALPPRALPALLEQGHERADRPAPGDRRSADTWSGSDRS